jgi:hypothetical protein
VPNSSIAAATCPKRAVQATAASAPLSSMI